MGRNLTWDGRSDAGDIEVAHTQAAVVELIARRMASAHYERLKDPKSTVIGHGAAISQHLHETDPKEWERFKADSIDLLRAMHGSGEKGLGTFGERDSRAYFDAGHALAATLRA